MNKEELKYWREELPKQFESSTKDFIIKWFLSMTHYPIKIKYNSNPKYKELTKKMHKENKIVHHSLDFWDVQPLAPTLRNGQHNITPSTHPYKL